LTKKEQKPKIAVVTLIQEGAVKVGGEHAMMYPYVEQIIRAAETVKDELIVTPYIITPKPGELKEIPSVEKLKEEMAKCNQGKMILVSNGADEPYEHPWNWERYGYEANEAMISLVKDQNFDGLIIMAHGFASIPAILDFTVDYDNGKYGDIPVRSYYITHSSFAEHKDSRPQRRLLEKEVHNHAGMIAISTYMSKHLEEIGMVDDQGDTIPLYNALPEKGWFTKRVPRKQILALLKDRNASINEGPFYGSKLPIEDILSGEKELVLYFGRAQRYVKGTDAIIACAQEDPSRHYMVICSGNDDELQWHLDLIENLPNITLAWEHNSTLVLGMTQLTDNDPNVKIIALFLSRKEPMGLVSRELLLMQEKGSILPIVSGSCGFDDPWQREYSFVVTNPCFCEDIEEVQEIAYQQKTKAEKIFIHKDCVKETIDAINKISKMSQQERIKRVEEYAEAIRANYTQDRYWTFYLQTFQLLLPKYASKIEEQIQKNNLTKIESV
jgi:hypothetical protein